MGYSIAVLIKQVPDMNAVRIDRATGRPVFSGQYVISSFDEYAIEEALRIKEAHGGEVVVISAGPSQVRDAIQRALGMGADRGVILSVDQVNELDTLAVAEILAQYLKSTAFDLVLCGQNSDDSATGHVGPQVAEFLGVPHVSSVTKVQVSDRTVTVHRDTEEGKQVVELAMPAVLMAMTGLNEPRYPSLKGIMAAKKKPVDQIAVTVPGDGARLRWSEPFVPERSTAGIILQDVPPAEAAKQLVAWLREQKLI